MTFSAVDTLLRILTLALTLSPAGAQCDAMERDRVTCRDLEGRTILTCEIRAGAPDWGGAKRWYACGAAKYGIAEEGARP